MKTNVATLTVILSLAISSAAFATEKKTATSSKAKTAPAATATPMAETETQPEAPADSAENFRCEKMRQAKLADLKAKLVENCNLKLPFSITGTDVVLEGGYTYCCTQKD